MISRIPRYPLLWAVVGWHIAWGLVALATDAGPLIEFLNGLVLAGSIGVVVTFFTIMLRATFAERPSADQILIVGIWWSWFATIEQRLFSIVWRALGMPPAFANTDFTTHFVSMMLLACLFHLAGPEAINGRVPTRQWVKIGAIAAAGVGLFAVLVFFGIALRSD